MPADEFAEETYEELKKGQELVVIGSVATEPRESYMELVEKRKKIFTVLAARMMAHFEK